MSATGTGTFAAGKVNLSGSLAPGRYHLVQLGAGATPSAAAASAMEMNVRNRMTFSSLSSAPNGHAVVLARVVRRVLRDEHADEADLHPCVTEQFEAHERGGRGDAALGRKGRGATFAHDRD